LFLQQKRGENAEIYTGLAEKNGNFPQNEHLSAS
jgi:hypothetical protein